MFDDGKLRIYRKAPGKSESGRPVPTLVFYAEVWYGDLNFSVREFYAALESGVRVDRRVRLHQDKALCDKFAVVIGGVGYDVGRVWHGVERGVPITDLTLAASSDGWEFSAPGVTGDSDGGVSG